jgi:hypothetical protein
MAKPLTPHPRSEGNAPDPTPQPQRTQERTLHMAVPWMMGSIVLSFFGLVARHSVVGGFIVLTAALGLVFGGQSILAARAAGIVPPSHVAISLG